VDYIWYIKGNQSEGHNIKFYPYIIDMQYFGDVDEIELSLKFEEHASGEFEMYAYYMDTDAFMDAYEILNSRPLVLESFTDTKITGSIQADRPGVLFTSIPFDRGWSVRLNGDKIAPEDIELFGEGFITVTLRPGVHKVEFSYMPENFLLGLLISICSVFIISAIILLKHKHAQLIKKFAGRLPAPI